MDDRPAKRLEKSRGWTGRYRDRVVERVAYDDEGRPHVVEEEGEGEGVTVPWQVSVREDKTGLIEPDQWIKSQSLFGYTHQHDERKPSKLARFRRGKHPEPSVDLHTGRQRTRRSSMASTTSSLSIVTPEDPTRSSPYTDNTSSAQPSSAHLTSSKSHTSYTRHEDDIFNHEF